MKATLWIVCLLLTLAGIGAGLYWAGEQPTDLQPPPLSAAPEPQPPSPSSESPAPPSLPVLEGKRTPLPPRQPLSEEEQATALAQGEFINALYEAGAEGTPAQQEKVYAALNHADPEVRQAAVDVIVQHLGRESIPRLRAALATTESIDEKKQIQEAIEFLELPTLEEFRQKSGGTAGPEILFKGQKKKKKEP